MGPHVFRLGRRAILVPRIQCRTSTHSQNPVPVRYRNSRTRVHNCACLVVSVIFAGIAMAGVPDSPRSVVVKEGRECTADSEVGRTRERDDTPSSAVVKEASECTAAGEAEAGREGARDGTPSTCSICLDQYREPKVLPCCHTFCKRCLQRLLEATDETPREPSPGGQMLACPTCKAEHTAQGGVDGFLTDFTMAHDLELADVVKLATKEEKPPCGHCESGDPSEQYCMECHQFLCDFCCAAHKRIKWCKDHKVLPVTEISPESFQVASKPLCCREHPGEAHKLYCRTCSSLICRDCALAGHRKHHFVFVAEHRPPTRKKIEDLREPMTKKLKVYQDETVLIAKVEKRLQEHPATVKKKINESFDARVAALESRRATLLAKIDDECIVDSKKVWAGKEFTESSIEGISSVLRFADRALQCSADAEMISLADQAVQRMDALQSKKHVSVEILTAGQAFAVYQSPSMEQHISPWGDVQRPDKVWPECVELEVQLTTSSIVETVSFRISLNDELARTVCRAFNVVPTMNFKYYVVAYGVYVATYNWMDFTPYSVNVERVEATDDWMATVNMGRHTGSEYSACASIVGPFSATSPLCYF